MRSSRITLLVYLFLGPLVAEATQSPEPPTIRLIATGGTISGSNRPATRLTADELIRLVPSLSQHVQVETEQFSNLPSTDLSVREWLSIAHRINRLLNDRQDLSGVVVTSGTDTLEEMAYFLNLTVQHSRPVVVVGAMRPPGTVGYDGAANLLQAFRVAAEPSSRDRGVLVVLNSEINSAREVTKTHAQRLDAFETRNFGILGVVDTNRITYYRRTDRRHTTRSEFDVSMIDALPRVDVLLVYQDAPGDLLLAVAEAGAAGMVIAGTGAGSMSPSQREATRRVLELGVPVVMTSRTGGGRVAPNPIPREVNREAGYQLSRPHLIAGEDLSPVKARILLMLALTQTDDQREFQRMFQEY